MPEIFGLARLFWWLLHPAVLKLGISIAKIHPDSNWAVDLVTGAALPKENWQLVFAVRLLYRHVLLYYDVEFHIVKSHSGLRKNEIVDKAAKAGGEGKSHLSTFYSEAAKSSLFE